ncbi:hypothetical protein OIU78_003153 [Salix suchowensis]|nr:hypothetical protein OIU78_003153 [Salix suchowensis]
MNPTTEPPQPQPPQPPQPHRPSSSCDRHPEEHFTGFCPSCLCERLAVLDPNTSSAASSSSSRKPTATAALRAIFKPPQLSSSNNNNNNNRSSSFFPELRRTKSFSASKNEGFSGVFEPQRRSCDVRERYTLWSLFTQDDERNPSVKKEPFKGGPEIEAVEPRISCSSVRGPVFESKEEEEIESETDTENGNVNTSVNANIGGAVLVNGVLEESNLTARNSNANPIDEIIEEDEDEDEDEDEEEGIVIEPEPVQETVLEELKTMKDHIDLDSQAKKTSGRDFKEIAATLPVEKPIGRQYRETQSEIADYGFGRRSCDTDPRFSLDAGRISFDDPRYSFDEPRASWDGYLTGRTFPRMPTMVSVVEDAPVNVVSRSDTQIPVEEPPRMSMNSINEDDEDETVPGGSVQTRDYYSDSSSRRRKSLDRSNSIRKTAAAVVAEIDELKAVSNAKVTPATVDYIHGPKLVVPDRDFRDSNSNSLRDDCSESFDMGFRDNASVVGNVQGRAVWRLMGNGRKKRDEFVLERNRSARYSPNNMDNGLLRFYLTPMRNSRRNGWGKSKSSNAQSIARSVLRLY